MFEDDEKEELFYRRSKAVTKEFLKGFLKADDVTHVSKGPTGGGEQEEGEATPSDPAAESAATFLLETGKAIIDRLTPEAVSELSRMLASRSVVEIGWEELSTLCDRVLTRCSSWLRERDDKLRAVLVTVGTVARELLMQNGVPEEAKRARIKFLSGDVAGILKEHNLEDGITDRQANPSPTHLRKPMPSLQIRVVKGITPD